MVVGEKSWYGECSVVMDSLMLLNVSKGGSVLMGMCTWQWFKQLCFLKFLTKLESIISCMMVHLVTPDRGTRCVKCQEKIYPYLSQEKIERTGLNVLSPWPLNSPDLNPLENIWGLIKQKLAGVQFNYVDSLWTTIGDHWEAVPPEFTASLIASMPDRMARVIRAKGGSTGY